MIVSSLHSTAALACAALAIEALIGYPDPVYRRAGHPVTWMGRLIAICDARLNRPEAGFAARRAAGLAAEALLLAAVAAPAGALQVALHGSWAGFAALAVLGAALPAQRSLHDHVAAVASALDRGGPAAGREAVSRIVGRDTAALDAAGVARAALESLAENFSDGVVAPALWMALGGLPGAALYKAVNTADSMVGHRTPRHEAYGWAAARLDDLVNLPASRLSALWIALACLVTGDDAAEAVRAALRDARRHRSPNAGWPEAALAGALGLAIGGPRIYGGERAEVAFMGRGRATATAADIRRALRLYRTACAVQGLALALAAATVR